MINGVFEMEKRMTDSEDESLGFGIIGCGVIAPFHAKGIQSAKGAKLVAVADIIPEKAQRLAEEYSTEEDGPVAWYKDYQDLLRRDDIHVVCICTPSGMHANTAVDAAQAGKHVLTEKPMAITLPQLDRMIAACRKAGVKLGTIFQRRTYESSRQIKHAIEQGKLGKLVLGDAYLKYYRTQEYYNGASWRGTWELDGGGALMNQGVHGVDLLQWLMGGVERVYARAAALVHDIEVEDTAVAVVRYKSGALGVIEGATSVYPGLETRLEIHGEKGTVILEEQTIKRWSLIDEEEPGSGAAAPAEEAGGSSDPAAIASVGFMRQIQDMVDAVREDREPLVSGEEGRKAVEIILAIYESARTGQEVPVGRGHFG